MTQILQRRIQHKLKSSSAFVVDAMKQEWLTPGAKPEHVPADIKRKRALVRSSGEA